MKRGPKPAQPTEQYTLPRDLHHQMVGLFERRGMPVFQDMTRFDRPLKLTLMAIYLQGLEDGYATAAYTVKCELREQSMTDTPPRCEDCRFWDNSVGLAQRTDSWGRCRRHAPQADMEDRHRGEAVWPMVEDVDWCGEGEFKEKSF